jgi:hypothetical protein
VDCLNDCVSCVAELNVLGIINGKFISRKINNFHVCILSELRSRYM